MTASTLRRAVAVALVLAAAGLLSQAYPGPSSAVGQGLGGDAAPFTVDVPDAVLDDLARRLARARFPDELNGAGWTYGTNLAYLRQLVEYWRDEYDWRAQERILNGFPQFTMNVDGLDVHFIHRRSPEPDALPIMMIHGWPGTFFEFWKTVDRLADPVSHGGRAEDAFHVVVPSLPGYGFSERPRRQGHSRVRTARMFMEVMARLGYDRYAVQAGDVGASVATGMAMADRAHVVGLHLNSCGGAPPDPDNPDAGLTDAETERIRDRRAYFSDEERGYSHIQGTRPQTLGYGLNDSPVGLAAWIVEKYRTWCDCGGDPEAIFTKDELLTTVMIYWITETATSAARYYYEGRHIPEPPYAPLTGRVEVPTGCTVFPGELGFSPRSWAETRFNVQRFTYMERGGHFAALEQPELFTDELRAFYRDLR